MKQKISQPASKNKRQRRVNDFGYYIMDIPEDFAATLTHNEPIARLTSQK
jgi:hypothetical protein